MCRKSGRSLCKFYIHYRSPYNLTSSTFIHLRPRAALASAVAQGEPFNISLINYFHLKSNTMNRCISIMLFSVTSLFIISCDNISKKNDLDKETTLIALRKHYGNQKAYETFQLTQGGVHASAIHEKFTELKNAGLITFAEQKEEDGSLSYTATLTEKGKQYVLEDHGSAVVVKHADLMLGDITAIKYSEDQLSADVIYTWKRYNITPFGHLNGVTETMMSAEDKLIRSGDEWYVKSEYKVKKFKE